MNFSKEKSCYRDLNSGPLPYQGSALPLSYNSKWSGKRDSNPRPPAWKASALSTELFPQRWVGKDGFEPPKAKASRFTVCPIWPLWNLPSLFLRRCKDSAYFCNCQAKSAIFIAVTANSSPLFPRRPPVRSSACSKLFTVSRPNTTGTCPSTFSLLMPWVTASQI